MQSSAPATNFRLFDDQGQRRRMGALDPLVQGLPELPKVPGMPEGKPGDFDPPDDNNARIDALIRIRKQFEEQALSNTKMRLQGCRTNLANSQKALEEATGFSLTGFFNKVSGCTEAYRQNVRADERMVADWEKQLVAQTKALEQSKKHEEAYKQLRQKAVEAEETARKLVEMAQTDSSIRRQAIEATAKARELLSQADAKWLEAISVLGNSKTVDTRAHMRELQKVNESFDKGINRLNNIETGLKVTRNVVIIGGAVLVTTMTGGAGTPFLLSVVYGTGAAFGASVISNSVEIGSAAYHGLPITNEYLMDRAKDVGITTGNAFLACLGARAGLSYTSWVRGGSSLATSGTGVMSTGGNAAVQTSSWGARILGFGGRMFHAGNAGAIGTTPSTLVHTALDIRSGHLKADFSTVSMHLLNQYAQAYCCSTLGAQFQAVRSAPIGAVPSAQAIQQAGREAAIGEARRHAWRHAGRYAWTNAAELTGSYVVNEWAIANEEVIRGRPLSDDEKAIMRYQAVCSHVTGMGSEYYSNRYNRSVARVTEAISADSQKVAQDVDNTSMLKTAEGDVTVKADYAPEARPRPVKEAGESDENFARREKEWKEAGNARPVADHDEHGNVVLNTSNRLARAPIDAAAAELQVPVQRMLANDGLTGNSIAHECARYKQQFEDTINSLNHLSPRERAALIDQFCGRRNSQGIREGGEIDQAYARMARLEAEVDPTVTHALADRRAARKGIPVEQAHQEVVALQRARQARRLAAEIEQAKDNYRRGAGVDPETTPLQVFWRNTKRSLGINWLQDKFKGTRLGDAAAWCGRKFAGAYGWCRSKPIIGHTLRVFEEVALIGGTLTLGSAMLAVSVFSGGPLGSVRIMGAGIHGLHKSSNVLGRATGWLLGTNRTAQPRTAVHALALSEQANMLLKLCEAEGTPLDPSVRKGLDQARQNLVRARKDADALFHAANRRAGVGAVTTAYSQVVRVGKLAVETVFSPITPRFLKDAGSWLASSRFGRWVGDLPVVRGLTSPPDATILPRTWLGGDGPAVTDIRQVIRMAGNRGRGYSTPAMVESLQQRLISGVTGQGGRRMTRQEFEAHLRLLDATCAPDVAQQVRDRLNRIVGNRQARLPADPAAGGPGGAPAPGHNAHAARRIALRRERLAEYADALRRPSPNLEADPKLTLYTVHRGVTARRVHNELNGMLTAGGPPLVSPQVTRSLQTIDALPARERGRTLADLARRANEVADHPATPPARKDELRQFAARCRALRSAEKDLNAAIAAAPDAAAAGAAFRTHVQNLRNTVGAEIITPQRERELLSAAMRTTNRQARNLNKPVRERTTALMKCLTEDADPATLTVRADRDFFTAELAALKARAASPDATEAAAARSQYEALVRAHMAAQEPRVGQWKSRSEGLATELDRVQKSLEHDGAAAPTFFAGAPRFDRRNPPPRNPVPDSIGESNYRPEMVPRSGWVRIWGVPVLPVAFRSRLVPSTETPMDVARKMDGFDSSKIPFRRRTYDRFFDPPPGLT